MTYAPVVGVSVNMTVIWLTGQLADGRVFFAVKSFWCSYRNASTEAEKSLSQNM